MFGPSMTACYATRALVCLARHGGWIRGSDVIACCSGVPRPYLIKILLEYIVIERVCILPGQRRRQYRADSSLVESLAPSGLPGAGFRPMLSAHME